MLEIGYKYELLKLECLEEQDKEKVYNLTDALEMLL